MTTTARLTAAFAALVMTFATVHFSASYAYPEAAATQLASAQR